MKSDLQADSAPPQTAAIADESIGSWWASSRGVWVNAAILAVALLILLPVLDRGGLVYTDEGVYVAQTRSVAAGSWVPRRPVPQVDLEGHWNAAHTTAVVGDRYVPYQFHPTFIALLVPFWNAGGERGMLVLSVIGTWGAAVSCALLARRIRPRFGVLALWLLGLGSPLVFDSYLIVAHSIAAALCGVALLGISRATDDRRLSSLIWCLPAVALLVTVRSEGVLVMGAAAGVVSLSAISGVFHRPDPQAEHVDWRALWTGVAVGVTALGAYFLDVLLRSVAFPSAQSTSNPIKFVLGEGTGPVDAIWASVFRPWTQDGRMAQSGLILAMCCLVLGAIVIRVAPRRQLLAVALVLMGAVAAIVQQFGDQSLITGLVAAFPVLPAGFILLRSRDLKDPLTVRLLGISALSSVALILTIWDVGGSFEWGGRYFHVLLPLLVPVIVVGLDRGYHALSRTMAPLAAGAVLIVVALFSASALRTEESIRSYTKELVDSTVAFASERSENGKPLVVIGLMSNIGWSRFLLAHADEFDTLSSYGVADAFRVAYQAKRHGYGSVIVLSDLAPPLQARFAEASLDQLGWRLLESKESAVEGYTFYRYGSV